MARSVQTGRVCCGPEAPKWFLEMEFEVRSLGWEVGHRPVKGVRTCVCVSVITSVGGRVFSEKREI